MVIITTIIDLSVLIPVLTPVLELLYLTQKSWGTGDDDGSTGGGDDKKNNMIKNIILNTIFKILCWSFKYIVL